ncbi:MAG: NAD(+) diphosphatase [Halocynthiibacter sp.]
MIFSHSVLDRAAHLREDDVALFDHKDAVIYPFWRSMPLLDVAGDSAHLVGFSPADWPFVAKENRIFLGLLDDVPHFAIDVSNWQPEGALETSAHTGTAFDQNKVPFKAEEALWHFQEPREVFPLLSPKDADVIAISKALLNWHRSHKFCARCGEVSEQAMAGWQRNCGACGGLHFPRTDPVVIMLVTHEDHVLLGRSHGWPDKMYSLLAGFVEPGETLEAATTREVLEETGISVQDVTYMKCQPWPYPNSLMVGMRAVARDTKITLDPHELDDAIWVPKAEVMRSLSGEHTDILPAREGSIAYELLKIWVAEPS